MPIVVVHGVNTRRGPDYEHDVQARDSLLRRFALSRLVEDPDRVLILNPYWGDLGAKLRWNGASVPQGNIQAFGGGGDVADLLLGEGGTPLPEGQDSILTSIAKSTHTSGGLREAVDLALALALQSADKAQLDDLALLAAKTVDYVEHNPHPTWLASVDDDSAFLLRLRQSVESWQPAADSTVAGAPAEAFGLQETWEKVQEGIERVKHAGGALGSGLALAAVRQPLTPVAARFLGDVFVYIDSRGDRAQPGEIVKTVCKALDEAAGALTPADPHLIVIAHSMGGNVAYDILSHYRPGLQCDLFVTVGSQVSLFEELKLFQESKPGVPVDPQTDRVPRPANIKRWLNVIDRNDVLSYAVEGVFDGAADFEYSTGTGVLSAHTTYFLRPSFFERLGRRMEDLLA